MPLEIVAVIMKKISKTRLMSMSGNERGCWSGVLGRPTAAPMPYISPVPDGGCSTG